MPAAGAYVVVNGSTFRVIDKLFDEVRSEVERAMQDGSVVTLDVVGERIPGQDVGQGTLFLHGGQLAGLAVLSGPLPSKGHAVSF